MNPKLPLRGISVDRVISYLGLLTAAGLVAALAYSQRVLSTVRAEAAVAGESVYLDRIRTEVLGWPLPDGLSATLADGTEVTLRAAARDASVVWIVDPTECTVCDDEARRLNRTVISTYPEVMTVFSGVSAAEARTVAESWGLRTAYIVDHREAVREAMGLVLPSSFFVLNPIGNVVHFEAHRGDQPCRSDVLGLAHRLLETHAGAPAPATVPPAKESLP